MKFFVLFAVICAASAAPQFGFPGQFPGQFSGGAANAAAGSQTFKYSQFAIQYARGISWIIALLINFKCIELKHRAR